MNASTLLFGVLPLIVFVVMDSFAGLKSGVIAAIVLALAEAVFTLVVYKTIDEITVGSTLLVLVFGLLSYFTKKPIYIKLQPVFLGVVFGLILLVMQFLEKPLLVILMDKYQLMLPDDMQTMVSMPAFRSMLTKVSGILGWGFLVHAALVAFAALRMGNWAWLIIRGVGLYVMMFSCALIARFLS